MWKKLVNLWKYQIIQNWKGEIKHINKNQRKLNDKHKSFLKQTPNPVGFTGGFY